MATLTVTPLPTLKGSVPRVDGVNFPNAKTRLLLDGVGATSNIFRPAADGSFHVGITVASTVRVQTLVAQQQDSNGRWIEVAHVTIPVVTTVPQPPPSVTRAIAVYVHTSAYDPTVLDKYAALVGRKPAVAMTYQKFGHTATGTDGWQFPANEMPAFEARGIVPFLSWQPYDWDLPQNNQPQYGLAHLLAGEFDAYINSWAAAAKAYGKPLWIRFAHEMNGDFYPWGQRVNGNTPAQYVAAFRRVVVMFRAAGATNVRWVWCPNVVGLQGQYPLTGLYPGDDVVDMVGIDGYNWGTSGQGEAGWSSFSTIFGPTYDQVRALAPTKPIYVGETGCTEVGGDKAAWIRSAFLTEIPQRFASLIGVLYFDMSKETDWRVESSQASLAAWQAVVASPAWQRGAF